MALPLLNKVALVTGSSRGLGREIALALAFQGASIVLTCVEHYDHAQKVMRQIEQWGRKATFIPADLAKPYSITSLFEIAVGTFGKLDIVVSNAGLIHYQPLADTTPDDFDKIFNVNTRGQFFVAQQAFKHLKEGGRLILMSSMSVHQHNVGSHAVYSASKAAVEAFARSLAIDFATKKITVNAVAPALMKTDMLKHGCRQNILSNVPGAHSWTEERMNEAIATFKPPGAVLDPAKVAKVVVLLASEEGAHISGQVINCEWE